MPLEVVFSVSKQIFEYSRNMDKIWMMDPCVAEENVNIYHNMLDTPGEKMIREDFV